MFQSVSHLKVLLHVLVGGLLGAFFLDGGNNGSKTINNLGYFFICIVYLSYTTMLPAVIRCKFDPFVAVLWV
jgi:ATP-binding cassette subfamily G (WHITE) protein 1